MLFGALVAYRKDRGGAAVRIAPAVEGLEEQEQIAEAKAGPAGGWINFDAAILDHAAVRLQIKTTDGEKLKLMSID